MSAMATRWTSRPPRLSRRAIAITGPDGAGKSTVCERVVRQLRGVEVSVWDFLERGVPFRSKAETLAHVARLDGVERMLTIIELLRASMRLADDKPGDVLVLNGYWYKYAASELAYGVPAAAVAEAVADFPEPTCTFFLELAPEEAWRRKGKGSSYERGLMRGTHRPGSLDPGAQFVDFQRKIRPHWDELERRHGPWTHISSTPSVEHVLARIEGGL
jgi:thymidylate kinase